MWRSCFWNAASQLLWRSLASLAFVTFGFGAVYDMVVLFLVRAVAAAYSLEEAGDVFRFAQIAVNFNRYTKSLGKPSTQPESSIWRSQRREHAIPILRDWEIDGQNAITNLKLEAL
jgi:hypothetical protein